ncbi:MAG TPA: hypothetical protein VMG34_05450 [Bacteroidota bacterium]|nr:hypothetical protein [Bacteroidota bacterium]
MARIALDRLAAGMIVDDAVTDLHGTILMQKGSVITQNGIKILRMWGISEVSIDSESAAEHSVSPEPSVDPRFVEEAHREVGVLFQHANHGSAFTQELMRLATLRIAKAKSERG